MVFTGLFLALTLIVGLVRAVLRSATAEYWSLVGAGMLTGAVVLYFMAFGAVGFAGAARGLPRRRLPRPSR